jgi:Cd2+/Zn2+-exporting ATPase
MMDEIGVKWHPCHHVGTTVHVAVNGEYAGHLVISDEVKETSAAAIKSLRDIGIAKTVMLTGDAREVGEDTAARLGIDEVYSELLPADKVAKTEDLLAKKPQNSALVFVGDGINDAPVLSRADIGIAMGAMGSDAAIEAADIVLMDDDPEKLSMAVKIARRTLRIVYENIVFALGVKALVLLLGALGYASMWAAVFADVGVSVIAILNAMRALRTKDL